MKNFDRRKVRETINKLTTIHAELHSVGLYSTGQKMHDVVREAGYELARILEKAQK